MNILIPVDDEDIQECKIALFQDVKKWAFLTIEEGQVVETEMFDNKEDISKWIDIVVVKNKDEYVWPFVEEQIAILIAPTQRYIDDIVEAYLFKELHEFRL